MRILLHENECAGAVTCKIFHSFTSGSTRQRLITAVNFGVGFFQESAPELVSAPAFHVEELPTSSWESIVDNDVDPTVRFPNAKVERSWKDE